MTPRVVAKVFPAVSQAEGAGAVVHRTIGNQQLLNLDPFLLLDEFELKKEAGSPGFPDHPHRGFETVTYMFGGIMTHRDTAGNQGTIGPGDIQWMTAGKGLVHSETPDYKDGDVHGMQLWVNLPARNKMIPPRYQDIPASDVPVVDVDGGSVRVLAGDFGGEQGPVKDIAIKPIYLDITLNGEETVNVPVGDSRTVFVYVIAGDIAISGTRMPARTMGVLANGDTAMIFGAPDSRVILVAGEPIGEQIARYGPFVMNTREEIMQAVDDFNQGRLG